MARVVVRVNPAGGADHTADLAMLAETGWRTLMLAKAESAAQVDGLVAAMGEDVRVVALCETAAGVLAAAELAAHPNVGALMWGAEDLVASMGGSSSRTADGAYRSVVTHARAAVLLAAAAHGAAAWDAVHLDLADEAGLAAEAEAAVALGCAATVCLHPRQVPVVRSAYTPAAEAVERAHRVLSEAEGRRGAFELDGAMVDEVVLAMNATLEGQTTAHYIAERLEGRPVRVTQLAHGLPVGGELDYLDEGTLAQALRARKPL